MGLNSYIAKRVALLRAEIAQIRLAELNYRTSGSKHPNRVKEHSDRKIRLEQILKELASLMEKDGEHSG